MPVRRITPEEARELMAEGHVYLDVRSVPEFEAGHAPGAWNVPLLHATAAGMAPNAGFQAAVERLFARDTPLVVACKAGGRSARAAGMLEQAGYTGLADMGAGFDGWGPRGLPVATTAEAGHSWREIEKA